MNDLIRRQDALKIVEDYIDGSFEWGAMMLKLQRLPSAQQWIPCSERLPEIGVQVLGTFRFQNGNGCLTTERMNINGKDRWFAAMGMEPIAWMPLPEPWKEVEDEQIH